jgi:hypothetical protein
MSSCYQMLILLALPTEARQFAEIKGLVQSLGKCDAVDWHSVSGGRPKPADLPKRQTAVQADLLDGGKGDKKSGAISEVDFSNTDLCTATPPRIIALHFFGLEVGEADR